MRTSRFRLSSRNALARSIGIAVPRRKRNRATASPALPSCPEGSVLVEIPIKTVSESNRRDHWRARQARVRAHRSTAFMSLRIAGAPANLPLVVTLIRRSPRALDDDNLRSAAKAARDGIADYLGIDDRDPRVQWRYDQSFGPPALIAILSPA